MTTTEERVGLLQAAGNNTFFLRSEDVIIDLLTDSGTGAMSSAQWAALMRGDESYAGSPSFERFEAAVQDILGFEEVIPTHQGRAAEHLLFSIFGGAPNVIPNNSHFDTTRANAEVSGAIALDHPCLESGDTASMFPFKGNMDLIALRATLECGNVPLVMVTVTNNAGGGQPVSLENLRGIRGLCDEFKLPLFIDACRFGENAWFIKKREEGQGERDVTDIVRDMFDLADGCTMSAKKDGMANIGGFLACRDKDLADELRRRLVVTEGFGQIQMAPGTFSLLQKKVGQRASINGATQIRAGVIRPEVVVTYAEDVSEERFIPPEPVGISIGDPVRGIRAPYFGHLGRVVSLPVEPEKLESESRARVMVIEFEDGQQARLPRANVEVIET